jgi:hypothetical protein
MREPSWSIPGVALHVGDCLDVLRTLPDNSIDAICTDPPYGLTDLTTPRVLEAIAAWMSGDRDHVPDARGFMGRAWDAFVPPPGVWDECLRVLKPGGHLVAFAGTRTWDLMGLSIRIAGFELRDTVADLMGADAPGLIWAHGQGFPKNLDVSKAIDKAAGAARKVIGEGASFGSGSLGNRARVAQGYRPTELNPDGGTHPITAPATEDAARWSGWGTALKPGWEPIILARKPLAGTVAANVLEHGTGALNIDASRVPLGGERPPTGSGDRRGSQVYAQDEWTRTRMSNGGNVTPAAGRWPTNLVFSHSPECVEDEPCAPDCPVAELDRQSGVRRTGGDVSGQESSPRFSDTYGESARAPFAKHGDADGASRYFPVFRYEAKAPASERPKLPDGTAWPTVKPLALMRWLVRLVTPPNGVVLDPFAGTGTTGEAALIEGFRSVLVERDPVAVELIKTRFAKPIAPTLDLFGEETSHA